MVMTPNNNWYFSWLESMQIFVRANFGQFYISPRSIHNCLTLLKELPSMLYFCGFRGMALELLLRVLSLIFQLNSHGYFFMNEFCASFLGELTIDFLKCLNSHQLLASESSVFSLMVDVCSEVLKFWGI